MTRNCNLHNYFPIRFSCKRYLDRKLNVITPCNSRTALTTLPCKNTKTLKLTNLSNGNATA